MSEAATPAPLTAPGLPDHAWLQLSLVKSGLTYRVATDGRYLVHRRGGEEEQRKPLCKFDAGIEVIGEPGQARLAAALESVHFFDLPSTIEPGPVPGALPNNESLHLQTIVVAARAPSGEVHTVSVVGAPVAPSTLGDLEAVLVALDHEAIGNWLGE